MLERFNIDKAKPVTTSGHLKLSKDLSAKINEERKDIENVPYSSAIKSYGGTRLDIAHAMGVVRRFMPNLKKEH